MAAGGVDGPGDVDPRLLEEAREDDLGPLRPAGRRSHAVPSGEDTVTAAPLMGSWSWLEVTFSDRVLAAAVVARSCGVGR